MKRLVLSGWLPGMKKVSLTELLRDRGGYTLARAKALTDAVLDNKIITIEVPDEELDAVVAEMEKIGVRFTVDPL